LAYGEIVSERWHLEAEIEHVLASVADSFRRRDARGIANHYHSNAKHALPSGGVAVGRAAIADSLTAIFEMIPHDIETELISQHIDLVTPTLAIVDQRVRNFRRLDAGLDGSDFGARAQRPSQLSECPDPGGKLARLTSLNRRDPRLHSHEQDRHHTMATNPMPIYSADDVLRIPIPPDLSGYELVDGELEPVTPVGLIHGRIVGRIYKRLDAHVMQTRTSGHVYLEAGFVLGLRRDPQRLRGPDVSFITQAKLDQAGGEPKGFFHGAPDLVVEIESAERPKALQQRIQDYLDAGTPLVWVIHSETNAATVYRADGSARLLREADELNGEDVLPGLTIPLRELFTDLN
jgi:Uma2 family endonuclease